ncbi:MAG: 30S ribosome-binding factor RbfA [Stellaceae bacterium]
MSKSEQNPRPLRIGEEMRHALARIFEHGLHDPALAGIALTVTEVRVSPDLKNATAFIAPLGGSHAAEVMAGLKRAEGYLRRELARVVKLRYAPVLHFALDTSFEHASQIDALLRRPEVARDIAAAKPSAKKTDDAS